MVTVSAAKPSRWPCHTICHLLPALVDSGVKCHCCRCRALSPWTYRRKPNKTTINRIRGWVASKIEKRRSKNSKWKSWNFELRSPWRCNSIEWGRVNHGTGCHQRNWDFALLLCIFYFLFFLSSGGWVKISLKLPHFHVSDTCRVSI